jgi:hypothetical protein
MHIMKMKLIGAAIALALSSTAAYAADSCCAGMECCKEGADCCKDKDGKKADCCKDMEKGDHTGHDMSGMEKPKK